MGWLDKLKGQSKWEIDDDDLDASSEQAPTASEGSEVEFDNIGDTNEMPAVTPERLAQGPDRAAGPPLPGLSEALDLMRSLPGDNKDLAVQLLRKWLDSSGAIPDDIGAQADARISEINRELGTLREEIQNLQREQSQAAILKSRLTLAAQLPDPEPEPDGQAVTAEGDAAGAAETAPSAPGPTREGEADSGPAVELTQDTLPTEPSDEPLFGGRPEGRGRVDRTLEWKGGTGASGAEGPDPSESDPPRGDDDEADKA